MLMPNNNPVRYTPEDFTMPVLLDTGSTLSYLPADLVRIFAEQF
jgi:hypothetical protein